MADKPLIEKWHEDFASDPDYVAETIALEFAERVIELMDEQGLTRAALAERLGVSQAYISRTLNAPPNLTLRTIAAFGIGLGVEPALRFQAPAGAATPAPQRA